MEQLIMNLYYIDSGDKRFYSKKVDAVSAAQNEADRTQKEVLVSKMFIAVDRDNIARMANQEKGFTKFVGRVELVVPRKRPRLKLKPIAAAVSLLIFLLPNLTEAADCTTRRSGSVSITTCTGQNSFSQCRSYRSGSVVKTSCR